MKLIILDRDGVINYDSKHYIKSPDEWLAIPGSLEAVGALKQLGFQVAIATNQSGIARGFYTEAILQSIHKKMQSALVEYGGTIDLICHCPHHPDENCNCRKPKPGLLEKIQKHFNISLRNVYYVGDSLCDVELAVAKQCKPVLVKTGSGKTTLTQIKKHGNVAVYENLLDFVNQLS